MREHRKPPPDKPGKPPKPGKAYSMPASANLFGLQIADLVSVDEPKPPVAGKQLQAAAAKLKVRIADHVAPG